VSGATVATGIATVTITNDDAAPALPTVSVSASDASGAETAADPLSYVVTRSGAATGSLTIALSWTGTALFGTDYAVTVTGGTLSATGSTLTLAAGSASATITVTPVNDTLAEPSETVILGIGTSSAYTVGTPASASGTIADDDVLALFVDDVSVTEGDRNTTASVIVRLSGASTAPVTVVVATQAGTALAGSDFVSRTATLTFNPGVTTQTFVVTIVGDRIRESTEALSVVLSSPTGATIGDGTATLTIVDNERALVASTAGPGATAGLTAADAEPALAAAVRAWGAAGANTTRLRAVRVVVADLPGTLLAVTEGNIVVLDRDAAGWGWSLDPAAPHAGRMDLLTVLAHELGHVSGLEHEEHGVMEEALAPGTRSLPASSAAPRRIGASRRCATPRMGRSSTRWTKTPGSWPRASVGSPGSRSRC
jgi:hypothetical protein